MWREGYRDGVLQGQVYDDVHESVKKWNAAGVRVYIYSSGSVEAQKLIFGHTPYGSLLPLLSGHFDTAVGAKQDVESYKRILDATGCRDAPERMLFLTDVEGEAKAAIQAGAHSFLVIRPGNAALSHHAVTNIKNITSFHQIAYTQAP